VAHALSDSPVGQLAWSCQLFGDAVSDDYILTNVTIYWLTNTAASTARFYYEDAHATVPTEPTTRAAGPGQLCERLPVHPPVCRA
jgi:hypothetical protein